MGELSNNGWADRALGNNSPGYPADAWSQLLAKLMPQQQQPEQYRPVGNRGVMSPSTGSPAQFWWNSPGAGALGVTQAPPLQQYLGMRTMR